MQIIWVGFFKKKKKIIVLRLAALDWGRCLLPRYFTKLILIHMSNAEVVVFLVSANTDFPILHPTLTMGYSTTAADHLLPAALSLNYLLSYMGRDAEN